MFGFEPITAAYNVLELARPALIIAGVLTILMFLFKGQIIMALATLFVAALLYFSYQPVVLENIGESTAKMLTIVPGISETINKPDTSIVTPPPPEQPEQPEQPEEQTLLTP